MEYNAQTWITRLGLTPHPEGGYFRETYRSAQIIAKTALPERYHANRTTATSIYFLLAAPQVSKLHRLRSDELWFYHVGSPLTIVLITPDGMLSQYVLGLDLDKHETLHVCIPQGSWLGAYGQQEHAYTLVSCVVAPGFEFEDFELAQRDQLITMYPQYHDVITMLT